MSGRLHLVTLLALCSAAPCIGGPLSGRIRFQTRLGGSGNETVRAMVRDADGNFYVAGSTLSRDFPATAGDPRPRGSSFYRVRNGAFESLPVPGTGSGNFSAACTAASPGIPGQLFAAVYEPDTRETGLFRSTNGGYDWTRVDDGLPPKSGCGALQFDPSTGALHLLASGVVWSRATDGTWTRRHSPWGLRQPYRLVSHPSVPNTLVAYSREAWFSSDGGESWTRTYDGVQMIAVDTSRPGAMYAAADKEILRSLDAGKTWIRLSSGPPLIESGTASLVADPSHAGTLYWSGGNALGFESWQTRDSGATWSPLTLGGNPVGSFVAGPVSGSVLAQTGGRVCITSDGGSTWTPWPRANGTIVLETTGDGGQPAWYASGGPSSDAFLAKFDRSGRVLWATRFGGAGSDDPASMAIDSAGDVWIAGSTNSGDYPSMGDSYRTDRLPEGYLLSPFVSKFSPDGRILASSVFSDFPAEPKSLAVDPAGNLILAGTAYRGMPTTPGALQPELCCEPFPRVEFPNPSLFGPPSNGFIVKLDRTGARVLTSTYLWGRPRGFTRGTGVAITKAGRIVAGGTALLAMDPDAAQVNLAPVGFSDVESLVLSPSGVLYLTAASAPACPAGIGKAVVAVDPESLSTLWCARYPIDGATVFASKRGVWIAGQPFQNNALTAGPVQLRRVFGTQWLGLASAAEMPFATFFGESDTFRGAAAETAGGVALAYDSRRLLRSAGEYSDMGATGSDIVAPGGSDIVLMEISLEEESTPRIDTVVESVRRRYHSIAPGERLTVAGAGFSPAAAVLFDGQPVKVWRRSPNEIAIEAPDDWRDPPWTTVVVEDRAGRSNEVRIPTRGLNLTLYPRVLNADGTMNSPERPARPGETIHFPVNGIREGAYMTFHFYCQGCRIATEYTLSRRDVPGIDGQVMVASVPIPSNYAITAPTRVPMQAWSGAEGTVSFDAVDVYLAPSR